jgi:hypothetical protein
VVQWFQCLAEVHQSIWLSPDRRRLFQ